MIKNKKKIYLYTSIIALLVLIAAGVFIKINSDKKDIFTAKKLDVNTSAYKKINTKASKTIKKSGVYLFNTGEDKVTYLILDGSHVSLKGEAPYFSDVEIKTKENSIRIYFNEELKTYPSGNYPEQRLIYKITKDKQTEYIWVFRNGEQTHFDAVIL